MDYPAHNKKHFYKYASADTAIAVLRSREVRYSSPLLFNDPFDIQARLRYDFDTNEFGDRLFEYIAHLVTQGAPPSFVDPTNEWSQAITMMRDQMQSRGFPRDSVRDAILPHLQSMGAGFVDHLAVLQRHWDELLPRLRVFSVSEEPASLLMWAHYAKDHSGVVLELAVLPDEDNALCAAKPVIYSGETPIPFTEQHLLDAIVGLTHMKLDGRCVEYACVKGLDWQYEKEWRVWTIAESVGDDLFTAWPLGANEVTAVYFGCKMDPAKRAQLRDLARQHNPMVVFRQAKRAEERFALQFEEAT